MFLTCWKCNWFWKQRFKLKFQNSILQCKTSFLWNEIIFCSFFNRAYMFFNVWKFSSNSNQPKAPTKCLIPFPPLVLGNSVPRLLTPGAFVSPQYSDCLLKLFTISFFYKWLSCLEKGRLLLWISALRSSVKYSFDLSIIVLTKMYLHFCVHSLTLISSRIEVAN